MTGRLVLIVALFCTWAVLLCGMQVRDPHSVDASMLIQQVQQTMREAPFIMPHENQDIDWYVQRPARVPVEDVTIEATAGTTTTYTINSVYDNYLPSASYCSNSQQYAEGKCNLRSAWLASQASSVTTYTLNLPANHTVYMNMSMKALILKGGSKVSIIGKNTTILATNKLDLVEVEVQNATWPANTGQLKDTNSAEVNYFSACVQACQGMTLNFSTCYPETRGDTYIRLYSVSSTGASHYLGDNDDYCGLKSEMFYQIPLNAPCQSYCLHMGCYSNENCTIHASVMITDNTFPQFMVYTASAQSTAPQVTISGLTIANFGNLNINGGAISINGNAQLTVQHVNFYDNQASAGGALYSYGNRRKTTIIDVDCKNKVGNISVSLLTLSAGDLYFLNCSTISVNHFSSTNGLVFDGSVVITELSLQNMELEYYGIFFTGAVYSALISNVGFTNTQFSPIYFSQQASQVTLSDIRLSNMFLGGVWIYVGQSSSDISISNVQITCSTARNYSAFVGIHLTSVSSASVSNFSAIGCRSALLGVGSALFIDTSTDITLDSIYVDGLFGLYGPGLFAESNTNLYASNMVITNCLSTLSGGGVAVNQFNVNFRLLNVTISGCECAGFGGGVYLGNSNQLVVMGGVELIGNKALVAGGGAFYSQTNTFVSLTDLTGAQQQRTLNSPHPYTIPNVDAGYTLDSFSMIWNATISVPGANSYIVMFDPSTSFQSGCRVSFSSNATTKVIESYTIATLLPGISNPAVTFATPTLYVKFVGPKAKTVVKTGLYGLKLYVIPVITNPQKPSVVSGNVALSRGGGVTLYYSNQNNVIVNTIIRENRANRAGGMMIQNGNADIIIQQVQLIGNSAAQEGGGVLIQSGQFGISMTRTTWLSNVAGQQGGGIYLGTDNGAGVYFSDNILVCLLCNFTGNVASSSGGAIYASTENLMDVAYSYFENNRVTADTAGGGAIGLGDDNAFGFNRTAFVENTAVSSQGGAVFSLQGNAMLFKDCQFQWNSASVGGAIATSNTTATLFSGQMAFTSNVASSLGGAMSIMGSAVWTTEEGVATHVVLNGNRAPRGAALFFNQIRDIKGSEIVNTSFVNNVASIGGTVFWIYNTYQSSVEPPVGSPSNVWSNNKAAYGPKLATQAIRMDIPKKYNVTVYGDRVFPAINATLFDLYGQQLSVDNDTTVTPVIVTPYNCSSYPFLAGPDLTGVSLLDGVAKFDDLQVACSSQGLLTISFDAQVGILTTLDSTTRSSLYFSNLSTMSFRKCISGEVLSDGQCTECVEGTYSLLASQSARCDSCKRLSGVLNCSGDNMYLDQGYWRRYPTTASVLPCLLDSSSCIGGYTTGIQSCSVGYTGPLCSVCSTGYYLSQRQCVTCDDGGAFSTETIAYFAVIGFLIFFAIVVYFRVKPNTQKSSVTDPAEGGDSDDEEENPDDQLTQEQRDQANMAAALAQQPNYVTTLYLWARAKYSEIVVKLKIVVSTYQVVASSAKVLVVSLPPPFSSFVSSLSFFNVSITAMFPFSCTQPMNFVDTILYVTLSPIIFTVFLVICFATELSLIRRRIQKSKRKVKGSKRKAFDATKEKYLNYFFFVSYLVLPSVTTTLFQWFICQNVDPSGEDNDMYDWYLVADMSISCQSPYYKSWTSYVVLMLVIYPFGIPALYLILLRMHKDELMNRDEESSAADSEKAGLISSAGSSAKDEESGNSSKSLVSGKVELSTAVKRLSFLWAAYHPKYWYWEIIETTRKLMLTAVLSVCSPGSSAQSILGVIFAWLYITVYSYIQPYDEESDNVLAAAGQVQIFFTFFAALIIQNHLTSNSYDILIGVLLVLLNISVVVLSFFFEMRNYHEAMRQKMEREQESRERTNEIRAHTRLDFAAKAGSSIEQDTAMTFSKKSADEMRNDGFSSDEVVSALHSTGGASVSGRAFSNDGETHRSNRSPSAPPLDIELIDMSPVASKLKSVRDLNVSDSDDEEEE